MKSAGFYFFIPKFGKLFMIATISLAIFLQPLIPATVHAASTGVVISEVQTGGLGAGTAAQEFVELKNIGDETISIDDWKIVYSSSTDTTQYELLELDGQIPAGGFVLLVSASYVVLEGVVPDRLFVSSSGMSATGGHVKLIDKSGLERDRVGWGTAQFAEAQSATAPTGGSSMQRTKDDSDNNFVDFEVGKSTPRGGDLQPLETQEPTEYLPIQISELLPDPVSPKLDSQDEFIELYNPNQVSANLQGYVLQAGNSFNYEFTLPNYEIPSKSFVVFYSSETKLTLSNTSSTVRLLDPNSEIINITDTYTSVGAAKSWAFINDEWQVTNQPTPGAINKSSRVASDESVDSGLTVCSAGKFRNPATNRCRTIESRNGLKPCNPDQFRNPDTNRCKKIETANGLTPCSAGQYRNPETNRCRATATTASMLKPCAADQFRNPATNRCKKKDDVASALSPCNEGQERNTETNRCRKVAGVSTTNPLSTPAAATKMNVSYPAIIAVGALALVYGLYEYRQEIKLRFVRIFSRSSDK